MTATAKPWLHLYANGQSAEIQPQHADMLTLFEDAVARKPELSVLRYFDGSLSLRALDQAANALAQALHARGFAQGDRLAIYTQNNPAFIVGLVAAWKLGGIAVPINPMNRQRELHYLLQDSGAQTLLCLDDLYRDVACEVLATGELPLKTVVTTSALDWQTRNDPRVLPAGARLGAAPGTLDLRDVVQDNTAIPPVLTRRPQGQEPAIITYTSGTTGQPKGAINSHDNMCFTAQVYRDWMALSEDDTVLALAPLFHITGLVGHVALSLLLPCPLVLSHRFVPEVMCDAMREHRPSFTIGAITAYVALMHQAPVRKSDFSSFRMLYTGGAPVAPTVVDAFETLSGLRIHNAYGMTETCSPAHATPLGARAPVDPQSGALSIGVPVYNTTARIITDQNKDAAVGEVGEIVVSGPQITPGYWNKPQATAEAMFEGGLRTGDVGFMDDAGWFYLVDRKKDMINAGGYKVWPREVEDVLYTHPAVREAAVIGVPDDYRGETVKAVVSLKPGQQVTPEALIAYCKAHMAAYKYPRLVEVREDLPKTVTGKILRRQLR